MKSLRGHFLVASQEMMDPNFHRTVVLMIEHSEEGALGVVLNRPLDKTIDEVWQQISEEPCSRTEPIHVGGPVSGHLMSVHDEEVLSELEVVPGVYYSAHKEHLDRLVQEADIIFKLFLSHSGWAPGQLEDELEQGAWLTLPATAELVFDEESVLWEKVTSEIGSQLLLSAIKIKHVPEDPTVN